MYHLENRNQEDFINNLDDFVGTEEHRVRVRDWDGESDTDSWLLITNCETAS